jgi:hypothetical protein
MVLITPTRRALAPNPDRKLTGPPAQLRLGAKIVPQKKDPIAVGGSHGVT